MGDSQSTLLVIDDEDIVRDTIVGYLEDSGFKVLEADNGETGLELFRTRKPDLVLCDLRMPRMDGLAVLRNVMTESPETPLIVVSGAGVMADVVEALRLGASDYLVKPLSDLAVLEHSVRKNLANARLAQENRAYREQLEQTNEQLKSDLTAGRKIQQKMLPPSSMSFPPFVLKHEILPSHYLSGDFVDYFQLSPNQLVFYLADVSGHGVSSAIITVLIKNFFSNLNLANRSQEQRDPSVIMSELNSYLIETGLERHATMFLALIDENEQQMVYCCAAHFPTPIIRYQNNTEALPTEGMPVGLFSDASYNSHQVPLSEIDALFLCSDGLLEIMPEETLLQKEARLLELVADDNNTIARLKEALSLEDLGELPDDITLLTVNREEL